MTLLHGWYRLRIVSVENPDPGVGGMYLTLAPDGEVIVAAMGPDTFEAQKWLVQPVNGGTDVYIIDKGFPGPQKGLREGYLGDNTDEVRVIFGLHPEEWRIFNAGSDPEVNLILPNRKYPPGVEHLVDTDGIKVVVKPFPIYPGDRPAWKFQKILED